MRGRKQGLADMKAAVAFAVRPEIKSRLLEGLSPSQLDEVLAAGRSRRLFAKHVVVHAGDQASEVYLLCSGRAQYFAVSDEGEKIILHWLMPGDPFGVLAFVPEVRTHIISVEIVESGSAIVWDRVRVLALAEKFPRLSENVIGVMYKLLIRMFYIHMSLSNRSAAHRLRQAVLDLSFGIGHAGPRGVEIDITNEELAAMANVTLFTASRYLSEWQRRGAIEKKRGTILVRSRERLLSVEV
jgi:CRP-like cAMP-binding protein